ncbi:MAG: hypothetical protein ACK4ZJ_08635, partial [Allorhizobium sp.]
MSTVDPFEDVCDIYSFRRNWQESSAFTHNYCVDAQSSVANDGPCLELLVASILNGRQLRNGRACLRLIPPIEDEDSALKGSDMTARHTKVLI